MVGRAKALAGSLMFALSERVGVTFSRNSAWWSWALRHACRILYRFGAKKAVTPYGLAFGREVAGALSEFGEPVFGHHRQVAKVLSKVEEIHTCCTMDSHWFSQEALDVFQRPGKDTL